MYKENVKRIKLSYFPIEISEININFSFPHFRLIFTMNTLPSGKSTR